MRRNEIPVLGDRGRGETPVLHCATEPQCLARQLPAGGMVKAVTAVISVVTAAMLIPLVPRVMSLPGRMHLQER